ncbi:type II toxin-antitoxin system death-on-curing family toxin [Rhizobacter sp. OV335]|jgi:death-on-curing protein|uniref:type II toxin-antitoxin system death-on-curing family toxin n=1 Tax=Rhizobacter sp. OV335 TaxID=1500264 RepID=UPI0009107369|nr:type II toxin-antitoxin system death-on-curing family toxin [Rhizobacter sp. OV335]SHM60278.1 death on curing protein [Rhizobacter sp. OV335]
MLDPQDVVDIHDLIVETEGGLRGDHGLGAVEGALSRVINRITYMGMNDAYEIAAMYAVAIARGHVFNDANKRTALVSALTYLATQDITLPRSPQLEDVMVDVAQGHVEHAELADIFFSLAHLGDY